MAVFEFYRVSLDDWKARATETLKISTSSLLETHTLWANGSQKPDVRPYRACIEQQVGHALNNPWKMN